MFQLFCLYKWTKLVIISESTAIFSKNAQKIWHIPTFALPLLNNKQKSCPSATGIAKCLSN